MKKTLGVVAAAALAALPMASVLAADSIQLTDTLALTIEDNCAFTRDATTAHTGATWTGDAFAATVTNGSTNDNIAGSKFKVVCNNVKGYTVTVNPSGFEAANIEGAATFAYNEGGYASGDTSSWYIGGMQTASSNIVKSESAATAGTEFTVSYNAKVSTTQQADTYNASAVYTLAQTK